MRPLFYPKVTGLARKLIKVELVIKFASTILDAVMHNTFMPNFRVRLT